MSADNWAICPRCNRRREAHISTEQATLDAVYGKVPLEQFDAMRAAVEALRAERPEPTFREDYELSGVSSGVLTISYAGTCQKCGLSLQVSEERALDLEA